MVRPSMVIDPRNVKPRDSTCQENFQLEERPEVWMKKSCEGSQQVANLQNKIKKVTSEFEGKTGHPSIDFQAPEKIKYPGRRKGSACPKYLPKDFGRANWRKISVSSGHAGLKAMVRLRAKMREGKSAATQKTKQKQTRASRPSKSLLTLGCRLTRIRFLVDATKNKTAKIKQEPLDPVDAPQKNGFKRPATALEDYQYDNRTSVGKRVKFQPGFPVSHEIVDDVKGGFSPTADGWCGFRVLAHLIYKDQNKFSLVKRDMLAALPKYKTLYTNTFGTDTSQLEKIIQHGSQLDYSNTRNTNTNFIPVCSHASMLFNTPDCAQLAVDTYTQPVCVYSDNLNTPSTTFLPFALPNNKTKQRQPLIFNHVNSNHWTTVDLSHNISRKWPTVPELFFLGCARNKIDDNFDTYWNKFKEFNKHDCRNAMLSLSILI
ncbi:hypothetical protein PHYBLDRAFT_175762 [Phycomyces blakesleeanus NRRL 1555(-)]|uniref:OTU domain-containing protein n=1 Tax=Phycomyces blakesleeanus (strain ATCC 8743b / DSM 1359 / FGSC 10004 / NBRC 33097 / NRRL 1555) TaxID=763407 RepID=A0A163CV35_PHYB8|nr:hypothetical protein PHYBLDRAFT_175762 [Phycomyces blakesleeanus NRRL 1555(-)]OAD65800.1 hypothetical protein PHYBLDRAFT_175762 [Phycomyces blakesleeanus NRRL 1555(-)]|eukprot:XP_018283840.1 hypothetical protein PHYBLDRAFT_175762 [Phycomyces blakesleeanus NRRL 1555(-)]